MNDLKEKAIQYAEVESKKLLRSAIAKAYMDGYSAGWSDKENGTMVLSNAQNVDFVDLGLPSGTHWAKKYLLAKEGGLIFMPYNRASKLSLPTFEQWQELKKFCQWETNRLLNRDGQQIGSYYTCTGQNGNYILFPPTQELHGDMYTGKGLNNSTISWFKKDTERTFNSFYIHCDHSPVKEERYTFEGWQLPIRLVR